MERWLPVIGYEGLYEVSDQGRVRSLGRTATVTSRYGRPMVRHIRPKMMKLSPKWKAGKISALVVSLWPEGPAPRGNVLAVHILVLEAFVGPRPDGLQGCHADDDPVHNVLTNLYWGTPSQNCYDASRNGRNWQTRKTHCKNCHEFTEENTIIRLRPDGTFLQRECRQCGRNAQRAYRDGKKKERP